ncbi:conserved hypothetical protein [Aspergillus terreus NIH2624]|uniref:Uncharacterized protein n=1 Tax=Aspergillus terreus (strain NIH 2624 / FGSC A1156) TaxID=341663 RepID=Q0C884_ASPTN|nr:uncharacterized protein ATEG_10100 [Aspergillus terreus NIH2624]EAU29549.1 conserved hypothetical protein [Aspergillus terreus NIH2624]
MDYVMKHMVRFQKYLHIEDGFTSGSRVTTAYPVDYGSHPTIWIHPMDITTKTFASYLPHILRDLSTCAFVSLDFEFSGIAIAPPGRSGGSTTLQERYLETKAAAEKYNIVQVGLTIAQEDPHTATYTLRAYNFYLSPAIDRRLDLSRDLCFQTGAVEFLLDCSFSLDSLYKNGVPYLSREEEAQVWTISQARENRPVRTELDVKDTDYESIAFLDAVRQLIDEWLASGDSKRPRASYLNIPPPSNPATASRFSKAMPLTLNKFHKSLVHRLIEIIEYDEEREKAVIEQRLKRTKERILAQRGFRWIVEALVGGDLSDLHARLFTDRLESLSAQYGGRMPGQTVDEFSAHLLQRLKDSRPVLVGHNLFTDLIYLYRNFLGPLPETVAEFQRKVHELFPTVVDTKYMATHNCGSINPKSSLAEINESMMKLPTPAIKIHPQHFKYSATKVDHEAGYDSMLTAQVFIKLSAQLHREMAGRTTQDGVPPGSTVQTVQVSAQRSTATHTISNRFEALTVESSESTGVLPQSSITDKANTGLLIPRAPEFWSTYGNKLRVFGTDERILGSLIQAVCRKCLQRLSNSTP